MADRKDNFSPTESERLHVKAMQLGSAELLHRLKTYHPRIVEHLLARAAQLEPMT